MIKRSWLMKIAKSLWWLASVVSLGTQVVATAAVPTTLDAGGEAIAGFELFRNGSYWWGGQGDCGQAQARSFIRLRGVSGGAARTLAEDCAARFMFVTRDDVYAYYVNSGRIERRATGTFPAGGSLPFGTGPDPGNQLGPITVVDNLLYWSEWDGTNFQIFRVPADNSGPPEPVLGARSRPITRLVFHRVPALHVFDPARPETPFYYDALFLLTDDGRLLKYDFNFFQRFNVLATGVSDFALRDELQVVTGGGTTVAWWYTSVYFIKDNQLLLSLDSETSAAQTMVGATAGYNLVALAVDDPKVYWISTPP